MKVRDSLSMYFAFSFLREEGAGKQLSSCSSHQFSTLNPCSTFICTGQKRSSAFAVVSVLQTQDRAYTNIYKYLSVCTGRLWLSCFHHHGENHCLEDLIFKDYKVRWHPQGSFWEVLTCVGRLSLAVRSLEWIMTVIPK